MVGLEEGYKSLMICKKLHEYVNLLKSGLQRMFVVFSDRSLTKLFFERYDTNMIRDIHVLLYYELLST